MIDIQPKSYNQIICYLKTCEVQRMLPALSDEEAMRIYHHLCADMNNSVRITNGGILILYSPSGEVMESFEISVEGASVFEQILVTTELYQVVRRAVNSTGWNPDDFDGGSANNNNNNNNNNNA